MKLIISARRENGQSVFLKDWNRRGGEMTEFQALAFDFKEHYAGALYVAEIKIEQLKEQFAGLSDWQIEEIKA